MIGTSQLDRPGDPEFMSSLARGLAVMRCVEDASRPATIAEVSRQTGLSRAAVRRCLYTLTILGYVGEDERGYVIRRNAAQLGHSHLSLSAFAARAQPVLDALRLDLGESCSLGVIENDQLLYAARSEASRIMSVGLRVGSHLPLYPTSMGRVLLAGRTADERAAYLDRVPPQALTSKTVTNRGQLLDLIGKVADDGHCIVDQELEMGLRSVAVPITARSQVVAALNIGTAVARIPLEDIRKRILPALLEAAGRLNN